MTEQEQELQEDKTMNGQLESSSAQDATCRHCWHQWGVASASISTLRTTARGTNRCCHCGVTEAYDYAEEHKPHPGHGSYYGEILRQVI
jgi:hypothetical protein